LARDVAKRPCEIEWHVFDRAFNFGWSDVGISTGLIVDNFSNGGSARTELFESVKFVALTIVFVKAQKLHPDAGIRIFKD
jgi:hypothetical protein